MPSPELLNLYLSKLNDEGTQADPAATAFIAQLAALPSDVATLVLRELLDQRNSLKLIASENYSSLATQLAMGNLLTDKYAEGYAGHRFYAGCDNVDDIETMAADQAKALFGADHAFVQPHSGIDANLVAFTAILKLRREMPLLEKYGVKNGSALAQSDWETIRQDLMNQGLLAMDYYSGGHLTHGYRLNVSSWMFDAHNYTVNPETKRLDMDAIRKQLHEVRPLIFMVGYSAYPRAVNFAQMRELADEVDATLLVDMAHFAGLVAGKAFTGDNDPVAHAHVVTSTTHKTLRGPRGGLVLCTQEFADVVDKACPTVLGGPLPHVMAAKAVAFKEAASPAFREYVGKIVDNARALAAGLEARGLAVSTGGTDNHLVLADVYGSYGVSGRQAESALRAAGITLNRNSLPFDVNGPWYTSGLRLGSPALTTRGLGQSDFDEIADIVVEMLKSVQPAGRKPSAQGPDGRELPGAKYSFSAPSVLERSRNRVNEILQSFPLYSEIDLGLIEGHPLLAQARLLRSDAVVAGRMTTDLGLR